MTLFYEGGARGEANSNEKIRAWSLVNVILLFLLRVWLLNVPGTLAFELYLPEEICSPILKYYKFIWRNKMRNRQSMGYVEFQDCQGRRPFKILDHIGPRRLKNKNKPDYEICKRLVG